MHGTPKPSSLKVCVLNDLKVKLLDFSPTNICVKGAFQKGGPVYPMTSCTFLAILYIFLLKKTKQNTGEQATCPA